MPQSHERRQAGLAAAAAVGSRWRLYSAALGAAAVSSVAVLAFPALPLHEGWLGLVIGAVGVLIACSLAAPPGATTRDERWSFAALRTVRGWHVTDDLPFEHEDVAHVVVSPSAVLAVQTRYRSRAVPGGRVETERHARDLASAERAAENVRRLLRTDKPLAAAPVVPVLVVSGPGAPVLRKGHLVESGVEVVDGTNPERWLYLFNAPRIDAADRRELHAHVQAFAAAQAPAAAPARPLGRELWVALRGAISAERQHRQALRRQIRSLQTPTSVFHPVPAPDATAVVVDVPVPLRTTRAGG